MSDDAVAHYIESLRASTTRLSEARKTHPLVGEILTADHITRGLSAIAEIEAENGYATFPPMFLYLLRAPKRLEALETTLQAMRSAVDDDRWGKLVRQLAGSAPAGAVAELAIYRAAVDAGVPIKWCPESNTKTPDFELRVDNRSVFIEVSVLTQGMFWDRVDTQAQAAGGMWSGAGKDFRSQAHRVSGKVSEKMKQLVPNAANVLALMFNSGAEHPIAREWGMEMALDGPTTVLLSDGKVLDFSNRQHLDCVIAFDYTVPAVLVPRQHS